VWIVSSIQGQVLRVSERREVAIYLRKGALWVADFIDGDGELVEAATWFRFNCGALSTYHARRRMVQESAIPLSPELVTRIENLHRPSAPKSATSTQHAGSSRIRSAIARIFRRLRPHYPRYRANPAGRGDAGDKPCARLDAARSQPGRALREIEVHSGEENGR